jgi:hypothetical protein
MNGIISLSDGAGTIIENGTVSTTSIDTDQQIIYNKLEIIGSTPSVSPTTGTLIVEGGGVGCTGNCHLGKSLYISDASHNVYTNNIINTDPSAAIQLYTTPNVNGIYLGNALTPLYVLSPIQFELEQFTNIECDNIRVNVSMYSNFLESITPEDNITIASTLTTGALYLGSEDYNSAIYMMRPIYVNGIDSNNINPLSYISLYPSHAGTLAIGNSTQRLDISSNTNITNTASTNLATTSLSVGGSMTAQNIICNKVQANNVQVNNNLEFLRNNLSTTAGALEGYITIMVGGQPKKIPYYSV